MCNLKLKQLFVFSQKKSLGILALLLLALTGSAMADEFSAAGLIEAVNSHDVQPLSDTHVVLLASMQEKLIMNDKSNPWHGATGPCGGSVEIINGSISGNGLCAFTDMSGDKFIISWIAKELNEKGGPQGVWEMTGGTGRYEGGSGGGSYSDIPTDDPKFSVIDITGNVSLK